jgi:hypothetical protein
MMKDPVEGESIVQSLFPNIKDYLIDVGSDNTEGKLWLLTAGKQDNEHFENYAYNVRNFDWQDFYDNWEGELFFEWLRKEFEKFADIVLIDSRTGVTEMGGICNYQLADMVVMFCAPNKQNINGTFHMVEDLKKDNVKKLRRGRDLNLLVVPSRVEDRAEQHLLKEFQQVFTEKFDYLIPAFMAKHLRSQWELAIPHVPYYAFNEMIAVNSKKKNDLGDFIVLAYKKIFSTLDTLRQIRKPGDVSVLIVESDEAWRESILSNIVIGAGFKALLAEGFSSALEILNSERVDIVITEIFFGDVPEGLWLIGEISKMQKKLLKIPRVIVLSGSDYLGTKETQTISSYQAQGIITNFFSKYELNTKEMRNALMIGVASQKTVLKVFVSYAHEDEEYKDDLDKMLAGLQNRGVVEVWHDRRIEPGADWHEEIEKAMLECDMALLLVSPDFLASRFVQEKELVDLLKRRTETGLRVVPIIVRPCLWTSEPAISGLQALPKDGKAVISFAKESGERDEVWTMIAKEIERSSLYETVTYGT